jgi:hypothetical protein
MQANDPPPIEKIQRAAPRALWLIAQHFFHVLCTLFGNPEDLARRHTLMRGDYTLTCSWLRVAEAMMRRLLLIEAAALELPDARRTQRAKRHRVRKLISYTADNPEAWRVALRCQSSPARGGSGSRRSRETKGEVVPNAPRFYSAWPLAERYEALVRAFNNPAPFARRLARRLIATPKRLATLLRAPPEAHDRVDDFDLFGAEAEHRWQPRLFVDTS